MSASRMALEKLGVVREVQSGWGKMVVGPILDRDRLSFREDSVCRAPEDVFYGPAAPSKGLGCGVTAISRVASSMPQESSPRSVQSMAVKSSPFYFGSANSVIERDEKSSKFWVRLPNSSPHGVDWIKLDCGKLYS